MGQVAWVTGMNDALSEAKAKKKPILLDFFNPGWIGCQQMDVVTYPEDMVAEVHKRQPDTITCQIWQHALVERFWHHLEPTLITLDQDGKEHSRRSRPSQSSEEETNRNSA